MHKALGLIPSIIFRNFKEKKKKLLLLLAGPDGQTIGNKYPSACKTIQIGSVVDQRPVYGRMPKVHPM
jgi:hypothetical protein